MINGNKVFNKRDDSLYLEMILSNFGDDKMESSQNFYSKILCRVSGLLIRAISYCQVNCAPKNIAKSYSFINLSIVLCENSVKADVEGCPIKNVLLLSIQQNNNRMAQNIYAQNWTTQKINVLIKPQVLNPFSAG